MIVLGIESSCDETAVAVLEDHALLSSIVASQIDRHRPFGGVVPEIAAREHLSSIDFIVTQALAESGKKLSDIDLIAVTRGPGLVGSLLVGVTYAKALAFSLDKPLIPVDHVKAHVHGALLGVKRPPSEIFPALSLVVSGGHCNFYHMASPTSFELIGFTLDDSCGECFDKVAKMLGLAYPGGPVIESLAKSGNPSQFPMPRAMSGNRGIRFSYSGLKTHVAGLIASRKESIQSDKIMLADLCAGFQEEALGQIVRMIEKAYDLYPSVRSVLIAGGVAANQRLRDLVQNSRIGGRGLFPAPKYCTDNAAMIAESGRYFYSDAATCRTEDLNWDVYARYPFESEAQ